MSWRFVVRGRVQGVGFRWFVLKQARALGLAGWVRNLEDGTVEVVADGAPAAIEQLARQLASGPAAARVTEVARSEVPERMSAGEFEVR